MPYLPSQKSISLFTDSVTQSKLAQPLLTYFLNSLYFCTTICDYMFILYLFLCKTIKSSPGDWSYGTDKQPRKSSNVGIVNVIGKYIFFDINNSIIAIVICILISITLQTLPTASTLNTYFYFQRIFPYTMQSHLLVSPFR